MNHCAGGAATDSFDGLSAIVDWVEQGTAPDRVPARALPRRIRISRIAAVRSARIRATRGIRVRGMSRTQRILRARSRECSNSHFPWGEPMRGRFATIAAAVFLAVMVGYAQAPVSQTPPTAAPAAGGRGGGAAVRSPEVAADGRVTFRLRAPNAKDVQVAMGQRRLVMERNEQGVWSATSDVLTPDYYTYSFVVDGTTVNDPSNRQYKPRSSAFSRWSSCPDRSRGCRRPVSPAAR